MKGRLLTTRISSFRQIALVSILATRSLCQSPLVVNNDERLQKNIPNVINALRKDPETFVPIIKLLYLDQIDPVTKIHKLNQNLYEDGVEGVLKSINLLNDPSYKNLKPFQVSVSLNKAANFHSSMMSKHGELGHIDDTGKGIDVWLKPFGKFENEFRHRIKVPESSSSSSNTSGSLSSSSSQSNVKYSGVYELVSVMDEKWAFGENRIELLKKVKIPSIPNLDNLDGLEVVLEWLIDDGGLDKKNLKLLLKKEEEQLKIGFATKRDLRGSHDIYNTLLMTKGFVGTQVDNGQSDVVGRRSQLLQFVG